jgi:hypothetical protein
VQGNDDERSNQVVSNRKATAMSLRQCSTPLARQCLGALRSQSLPSWRFVPSSLPKVATRSLQLSTRQSSPRLMSFRPMSTSSVLRFVKTETTAVRSTYYPRSSGSGGGGGQGSSHGPFKNFTRWLNRLPHMTVIYGIIGVNVGVFLLWQYGIQSYVSSGLVYDWLTVQQRFRDPTLYKWMSENFVLNEANVMAGRV